MALLDLLVLDPVAREVFKYVPLSDLPKLQYVCLDFKRIIEDELKTITSVPGEKLCSPFRRWHRTDAYSCASSSPHGEYRRRLQAMIRWLSIYCPNLRDLTDVFMEPDDLHHFVQLRSVRIEIPWSCEVEEEERIHGAIKRYINGNRVLEKFIIRGPLPENPETLFAAGDDFPPNLSVLDLTLASIEPEGHIKWFGNDSPIKAEQMVELAFPQGKLLVSHFSQTGQSHLTKFLERATRLEKITLSNGMASASWKYDYSGDFSKLTNLKHLSAPRLSRLSTAPDGVEECSFINKILEKVGERLETLSIVSGPSDVNDYFEHFILSHPSLWYKLSAPFIPKLCPNLRSLTMAWLGGVVDSGFGDIIGNLKSLESLTLHQLLPQDCADLCRFLNDSSSCQNLSVLALKVTDNLASSDQTHRNGRISLDLPLVKFSIEVTGNIQIDFDCRTSFRSSLKVLEIISRESSSRFRNIMPGIILGCENLETLRLEIPFENRIRKQAQKSIQSQLPALKSFIFDNCSTL